MCTCGFIACSCAFNLLYEGQYTGPNSNAIPFNGLFLKITSMGLTFFFGALVYMTKFPENYYPNYFVVIHSHVLWHLFVLCGIIQQLYIILEVYKLRTERQCLSII